MTTVLRSPGRHHAERRRLELRRVDQVLPAGREHAQRGGQLLREGRARRLRARPRAAARRPRDARRPHARAVAALREDRHRRARGRHRRGSQASSPAATCREFFARYVDGTEDPPLASLLADFGVTMHLRPATGSKDRGGKPASGAVAALHARHPARRGSEGSRPFFATARRRAPASPATTRWSRSTASRRRSERIADAAFALRARRDDRGARVPPRRAHDVSRDARGTARPTRATSRSTQHRRRTWRRARNAWLRG